MYSFGRIIENETEATKILQEKILKGDNQKIKDWLNKNGFESLMSCEKYLLGVEDDLCLSDWDISDSDIEEIRNEEKNECLLSCNAYEIDSLIPTYIYSGDNNKRLLYVGFLDVSNPELPPTFILFKVELEGYNVKKMLENGIEDIDEFIKNNTIFDSSNDDDNTNKISYIEGFINSEHYTNNNDRVILNFIMSTVNILNRLVIVKSTNYLNNYIEYSKYLVNENSKSSLRFRCSLIRDDIFESKTVIEQINEILSKFENIYLCLS